MRWALKDHAARTSLKWLSFAVAIWLMTCVGTQDTFAIYSSVLKVAMKYDEAQLLSLAGAKDTGKGFGLVAGILSFLVPLWIMLTISIVQSVFGFGFLWLVIRGRIAPPPYTLMYIVLWISGNSITWMNTAALVVSIQNFPFNRGTVVGILKGIQGLSAAIYVQLGTILFKSSLGSFLILLAFLPSTSCLIGIALLQRVPPVMSRREAHQDLKNFTYIYVSTIVLALYILVYNIGNYFIAFRPLVSSLYLVLLVLFLAIPIFLPFRSLIWSYCTSRHEVHPAVPTDGQMRDCLLQKEAEDANESIPLVADSYSRESQWMHDVTQASQSSDIAPDEPPRAPMRESHGAPGSSSSDDIVREDSSSLAKVRAVQKPQKVLKKIGTHHFTVKDAWGAKEFWLLFFSFFCGIGMSITLQNNLSLVAEALGYKDVAIFMTIFSVSTFFGRILGGGISEFLIRLAAIPRPLLGAIMQTIMVVNYVQLAMGFPGALYFGTFFAGITAGVEMTIAIATASELFGLKFIGMLYNFLLLVYPLAGNLFSGVLVEKLYDYEANKVNGAQTGSTMTLLLPWTETHRPPAVHGFQDEAESCAGVHCFRWIFSVMAGISALGVVLNLGLLFRVRRLYRSWYWKDSLLASARVEDVPAEPLLISHA